MLTIKWSYRNGRMTKTFAIGIPLAWILTGFLFMILMGILHNEVNASIPALGYGMSAVIMLFVQVISALHRSGE